MFVACWDIYDGKSSGMFWSIFGLFHWNRKDDPKLFWMCTILEFAAGLAVMIFGLVHWT